MRTHRRPRGERVEPGELGCRDAGARVCGTAGVEEDAHASECRRPCLAHGTARRRPATTGGLQGCGDGQGIEGQGRDEEHQGQQHQAQGCRQPNGQGQGRRAVAVEGHARPQAVGQGRREGREEAGRGREGPQGQGGRAGHLDRRAAGGAGLRARRPRPALHARVQRRQGRGQGGHGRAAGAARRPAGAALRRVQGWGPALGAARHPGHGHLRQGRDHAPRRRCGRPAGRAHHLVQGADRRGEAAPDFLWRIRNALPQPGQIGVFDRSHYEDVLIVRVHELVPRADVDRAATPRSTPSSRASSTAARSSSR